MKKYTVCLSLDSLSRITDITENKEQQQIKYETEMKIKLPKTDHIK